MHVHVHVHVHVRIHVVYYIVYSLAMSSGYHQYRLTGGPYGGGGGYNPVNTRYTITCQRLLYYTACVNSIKVVGITVNYLKVTIINGYQI